MRMKEVEEAVVVAERFIETVGTLRERATTVELDQKLPKMKPVAMVHRASLDLTDALVALRQVKGE